MQSLSMRIPDHFPMDQLIRGCHLLILHLVLRKPLVSVLVMSKLKKNQILNLSYSFACLSRYSREWNRTAILKETHLGAYYQEQSLSKDVAEFCVHSIFRTVTSE